MSRSIAWQNLCVSSSNTITFRLAIRLARRVTVRSLDRSLADITGYAEITPYKGGGCGNGLSVDIAAFAGSRIVSM